MRLSERGSATSQHLTVLALVALAGLGGLGTLGTALGHAVRGEAAGSAPTLAAAVSSEAGLGSAVKRLATGAKDFHPLRRLAASADDLEDVATPARKLRNPLPDVKFEIPWNRIRAEHVEPSVDAAIARANARFDVIGRARGRRTYANTVKAISDAVDEVDYIDGIFSHLNMVLDDPELSAAYARVQGRLQQFSFDVYAREDLANAMERFAKSAKRSEMSETQLRHARSMYTQFKQAREASPADNARMVALQTEMSELNLRFMRNVEQAQTNFEIWIDDADALVGMPERGIEVARASAAAAGKPGKLRLTLQEGTAHAALSFVHDSAVREQVWRSLESLAAHGEFDNQPIIARMLELRREIAASAGTPSYADMAISGRMVGDAEHAEKFIRELGDSIRPHMEREFENLKAFRRSMDGGTEIKAWDWTYWERLRRRALMGPMDVRPFLTLDNVLGGVFEVANRLYGIKFEEVSLAKWHPDVRSFRVFDEDGTLLGHLQLDLFERAGKKDGAWFMPFWLGEGRDPTAATIVANIPAPAPGQPAFLNMQNATTVFHEFGHALHGLFSESDVRQFGGTIVSRDFVELPSQLFENWVWEKEALDLFARHFETGEKIPDEVFEQLKRARQDGAATSQMFQLSMAAVDLALHRHFDPAKHGDALEYARRVMQDYFPYELPEGYAGIADLYHIFPGGYSAGYYGYAWAEALEADAFGRFKAEGILSRAVGEELRRTILSKGRTAPASELFRRFMGRDPDSKALLRRMGFADDGDAPPSNVKKLPRRRAKAPTPKDTTPRKAA